METVLLFYLLTKCDKNYRILGETLLPAQSFQATIVSLRLMRTSKEYKVPNGNGYKNLNRTYTCWQPPGTAKSRTSKQKYCT